MVGWEWEWEAAVVEAAGAAKWDGFIIQVHDLSRGSKRAILRTRPISKEPFS